MIIKVGFYSHSLSEYRFCNIQDPSLDLLMKRDKHVGRYLLGVRSGPLVLRQVRCVLGLLSPPATALSSSDCRRDLVGTCNTVVGE